MSSIEINSAPAQTDDANAAALEAAAAAAPASTEEAAKQVAEAKASSEAPQRPDHIPEKFWNAEKGEPDLEAWAKSYTELEQKQSGKSEEKPEEGTEENTEEKGDDDADEKVTEEKAKAEETPKASEVVATLNERFAENGELSEDDYKLAESIGHDKATVDQFIAGQKALAEAATARITEAAGGKENMDSMFAWAKTGLTTEQIEEYNASFQGNDVNAAVLAMEGLKAKYEAANGKPAKLVSGKSSAGSSVDTFQSWAEVTTAMSDPKYRTDPAYAAKVQAKLQRSPL